MPVELDRALVANFLGAALYWRMAILGRKANTALIERLTALLCRAFSHD